MKLNDPKHMKRRRFLGAAITSGATIATCGLPYGISVAAEKQNTDVPRIPDMLDGMHIKALREDYRHRLFDQYLPFWGKGGIDREYGGFMCELNDDGSVAADVKSVWYQGRGLWVYAFLFNHFGKDSRWLDIATKAHDFMIQHMYAGKGRWVEIASHNGTITEGVAKNVYGGLFAAGGLAQYDIAIGNRKDLDLVQETIAAAIKTYDDPGYDDTYSRQYAAVVVPEKGLRSQGHSMVLVWVLSQLLEVHEDATFTQLQRLHVDLVLNRFWNPDFGIANEFLDHEYERIPGAESHMYAGHSLETLWIVMYEALRIKDRSLFDVVAARIRRVLEMCWDYVLEGFAGGNYFVFDTPQHQQGPDYGVKTMWSQCEILIACLTILEYTGQSWAKEWYDRARDFTLKAMPVASHGIWRQAVDRCGNDVKRTSISTKRKDNFHQVRMLMLNLLTLDRMIANQGQLTPFPS